MRVLLVPEVYRPGAPTACGTVSDAVSWVMQWLSRDPRLHVYWLLPPREDDGYDAADVAADRDRVTLIEAPPLAGTGADRGLLTEDGYSPAELEAIASAVYEPGAYVDVVVDQRRTGRPMLYKWLLARTDHWAADVSPVDVVANVHDLQVPEKYRWCGHRNAYQMHHELCAVAFADGRWFTAGVDADRFRERAREILRPAVVRAALDRSVTIGSPVEFDACEPSFGDRPRWLHVAGSGWAKKHRERVLELGAALHEAFGIRTVLTSPEPVPARHRDRPFVDAHPEASRETYERALRRGDLAICASEYETLARTPFEQAASGQVLVLRDEPWIEDCVPADYRLAASESELDARVRWAVANWDRAVAETRRLVEHVREVRAPAAVGHRTHADLVARVRRKCRAFADADTTATVRRALASAGGPVAMDDVVDATAEYTDDGRPITAADDGAYTDVLYALRSLGWADRGDPGTPVFERVSPEAHPVRASGADGRTPRDGRAPSTSDR